MRHFPWRSRETRCLKCTTLSCQNLSDLHLAINIWKSKTKKWRFRTLEELFPFATMQLGPTVVKIFLIARTTRLNNRHQVNGLKETLLFGNIWEISWSLSIQKLIPNSLIYPSPIILLFFAPLGPAPPLIKKWSPTAFYNTTKIGRILSHWSLHLVVSLGDRCICTYMHHITWFYQTDFINNK